MPLNENMFSGSYWFDYLFSAWISEIIGHYGRRIFVRKMFLLLCLCNFLQVFIYSGCKSLLFFLGLIFKVANCVTSWLYIRDILMVNCMEFLLLAWFCPPTQRVNYIIRYWHVAVAPWPVCSSLCRVRLFDHYWFIKASSGFILRFFLSPSPTLIPSVYHFPWQWFDTASSFASFTFRLWPVRMIHVRFNSQCY